MPHPIDNFATGQVSVADTATQIVPARRDREGVMIVQHGTTAVFLGDSGVTTTTGVRLTGTAGAFVVLPTTRAVYGIVASGTQTVSYAEIYD